MKRRLFLVISFLWIAAITSVAQYQVNCISDDGSTMTFRVLGYGKSPKKASNNAEISVIKALLYNGIPNTQQSLPIIADTEYSVEDKHQAFFNKFYGGEYKNYIIRSKIIRKFAKDVNKQKIITLDVTVNVSALRNTLIKNDVIRKFGL